MHSEVPGFRDIPIYVLKIKYIYSGTSTTTNFQVTTHLNGKIFPLVTKEISGYERQKYATAATRRSQSLANVNMLVAA